MDPLTVISGIIAIGVSILISVILVFVTFRIDIALTKKIDEIQKLLDGNKSIAIMLGAVIISQAILLRHALHPIMVVIRNSMLNKIAGMSIVWAVIYCLLFLIIISIVSIMAAALATWMFAKMNKDFNAKDELMKDNVAVAIFLGTVVIAIVLIVEGGVSDLAESIIPYVERGFLTLK